MHARARVCRSHRSHIARTTQHRPPLSPLLLHRACPGSCIGPVRSDQLKFKIFHYCFKALQILLVTLYFTHLMACGFYYVGAQEYYRTNSSEIYSWLTDAQVPLANANGLLEWSQVGAPYVAALYWTFTTITTVGYGDLTPTSTGERIYAIVRAASPARPQHTPPPTTMAARSERALSSATRVTCGAECAHPPTRFLPLVRASCCCCLF